MPEPSEITRARSINSALSPIPLDAAMPSGLPPGDDEVRREVAALAAAQAGLTIEARSQFQMARARFFRHKMALIGLGTFVAILLFATVGPVFWKYTSSQITPQYISGPSMAHPFGTDTVGHDMFAQVMSATATSIQTALVVAGISTVVGTLVGAVAGYYGKWADALLMRFTDLILIVPALVILLVVANTVSKTANNWFYIALILAGLFWTIMARLVRGRVTPSRP